MALISNTFGEDYGSITLPSTYKPRGSYSLIYSQIVDSTRVGHQDDHLFNFLCQCLGHKKATDLYTLYRVGTIPDSFGATVFWQTDTQQLVRTGRVTQFLINTRQPNIEIGLAHVVYRIPNFNVLPCFFGEHLLSGKPSATIAIVGDEVTAMIGAAFFPNYVWLASRELLTLQPAQLSVLSGRNIVLYPALSPDGSVFRNWTGLADCLRKELKCEVSVSAYLEEKASDEERAAGFDIAEFLIRNVNRFERKSMDAVSSVMGDTKAVNPVPRIYPTFPDLPEIEYEYFDN